MHNVKKNLIEQLEYTKERFKNYIQETDKFITKTFSILKNFKFKEYSKEVSESFKEFIKDIRNFKEKTHEEKILLGLQATDVGLVTGLTAASTLTGNMKLAMTGAAGIAAVAKLIRDCYYENKENERTEQEMERDISLLYYIEDARDTQINAERSYYNAINPDYEILSNSYSEADEFKAYINDLKVLIKRNSKYTDEDENTRYVNFKKAIMLTNAMDVLEAMREGEVPDLWKRNLEEISFPIGTTEEDIDKYVDKIFESKVKELDMKTEKEFDDMIKYFEKQEQQQQLPQLEQPKQLEQSQQQQPNTRARKPGQGLQPKTESQSKDNSLQM